MSRKSILVFFSVLVFALGIISVALAGDQPAGTKTETSKAKTTTAKMAGHSGKLAANEVAVCACGKVFKPTASTKYIEYEGKSYACCSDPCHEKGMKDPAAAAKMAEENMAKLTAPPVEKK